MNSTKITLYALIILCHCIALCLTVCLFVLMYRRRSIVKKDRLSYLLIANAYIVFALACPLYTDMSINAIYGELHPTSDFNGPVCLFKGLMSQMCGSVYFNSFLLQAVYRCCRIVYPARATFQSFRVYALLSAAQWPFAALILTPSLIVGDITYLPDEYHCEFPPTNVRGTLAALSVLFMIPFALTLLCYFYTMNYVRNQTKNLTSINQNANMRRDTAILGRLVLLFSFVSIVGVPHILVPISYAITGYDPPWAVSCTWYLTFFSFITASIIEIRVSPHLRKLFSRTARVFPVTRQQQTAN